MFSYYFDLKIRYCSILLIGAWTQWRAAFQVFYGISVPITAKLKVHASFKYLLTRDDDNLAPKDNGWKVDTSGRWHLFRFGPHWDTKYHVLQIGLQWQLF